MHINKAQSHQIIFQLTILRESEPELTLEIKANVRQANQTLTATPLTETIGKNAIKTTKVHSQKVS